MNIVLYTLPFRPLIGGMERFAEQLAGSFAEAGHEVVVVTPTQASSAGYDDDLPFKVCRGASISKRWRHFSQADAVLFVGITLVDVLIALSAGASTVVSHHIEYRVPGRRWVNTKGWLKRQVARAFVNVAVSRFVAARLEFRCAVIHNSFDDTVFYRGPRQAPAASFAFCGRLVSDKGCDVLLRAFAIVAIALPSARLTIIGDGPERSRLERLAHQSGIARFVAFRGAMGSEEVASTLRNNCCLVVPSLWAEPFGIVALEGLASGCSLVVSCRGGLPEAAGPTADIVEPDAEQLAAAMIRASSGSVEDVTARERFLRAHTRLKIAAKYLRLLRLVSRESPNS